MEVWGNSVSGIGNSLCKGPEAGVCLVCLRNSRGPGEDQSKPWVTFGRAPGATVQTLALTWHEMVQM